MKFIVIAGTSAVMPFAVEVDADTLEQAVTQAIPEEGVDLTLSPVLVIDVESGRAVRPFRSNDGWEFSDTAYRRDLGLATPDEYFNEPQTAEMSE
jgi:hypothetical protein